MKIITIIDFRVFVYIIQTNYVELKKINQKLAKSWASAAWGWILLRGFTGIPYTPHIPVVVDDCGEYWKKAYLKENYPLLPEYKAGRKNKTEEWWEIEYIGKDTINALKIPLLSYEGYEADDLAGGMVKLLHKNPNNILHLHTIDTDWMGLIKKNVMWCNLVYYIPRYRDLNTYMSWVEKKQFSLEINTPEDIWKSKAIDGDRADNLPPNSPIEVIDLLNPPPQYDITKNRDFLNQLAMIDKMSPVDETSKLKKSQKYISRQGLMLPFTDFNLFPVIKPNLPILKEAS